MPWTVWLIDFIIIFSSKNKIFGSNHGKIEWKKKLQPKRIVGCYEIHTHTHTFSIEIYYWAADDSQHIQYMPNNLFSFSICAFVVPSLHCQSIVSCDFLYDSSHVCVFSTRVKHSQFTDTHTIGHIAYLNLGHSLSCRCELCSTIYVWHPVVVEAVSTIWFENKIYWHHKPNCYVVEW